MWGGSTSDKLLAAAALAFLLFAGLAAKRIAPNNQLKGRGKAPLPMTSLGERPILQVELARNEDDLQKILTAGDLAQNVADARAGNRLDSLLFIPGYAGFLIFAGLALRRVLPGWERLVLVLVLVAVPIAALCDWWENAGITKALDHIEQHEQAEPGDAARIAGPSLVKWCLLTLILLVYGAGGVSGPILWLRFVAVLFLDTGLLLAVMLSRYGIERFT
jgi:hypothetical protein